jgi:hypothetical protein
MLPRLHAVLAALVALPVPPPLANSDRDKGGEFVTPADIRWRGGPPSLPEGAKVAVREGDPSKEGPFVLRIRLPDGFRVMPHTHPKDERVTVISGTLYLGEVDKFSEKAGAGMNSLDSREPGRGVAEGSRQESWHTRSRRYLLSGRMRPQIPR